VDDAQAGVVGFAEGGWAALRLAAEHGDLVDRLVLVSTPVPASPDAVPQTVAAKTLLVYGSKDPAGGHRQAVWWKERLGGRIEMVPGAGRDILADVWPRVLSHLAPRSLRAG
jgi:pimeloyl-ACP methyl ester carboxylesterase